jgi:hypothetical protein
MVAGNKEVARLLYDAEKARAKKVPTETDSDVMFQEPEPAGKADETDGDTDDEDLEDEDVEAHTEL